MKHFIIILLFIVVFKANAQNNVRAYSIKGTVSQVSGEGKVLLRYFAGDKLVVDSAVFINHQFSFTGEVDYPVFATLALKIPGTQIKPVKQIFIEGGVNFIVTGTNGLDSATIKGGPIQTEADALNRYLTNLPEYKEIWRLSDSNKVWIKTDTPKAVAASKKMRGDAVIVNRMAKEYLMSHPDSYLTLINASQMKKDDQFTDSLYNVLTPRLKNTYYGKKLKADIDLAASLKVGSTALEFEQPDTTGKEITLKSFRGQYVLVDFWASWCAPCRAENPNVAKAFQLYKNKNFTVIGISLDDKAHRENWIKAIKKDGLQWTQVSDLSGWKNQAAKLYGITAIPQNFLIDPNGIIIGENLRGEDLNKKLASIFN